MAQSGIRTLAVSLLLLAAIAPHPASLQTPDPCALYTLFKTNPASGSACYEKQCASDWPPEYCGTGSEAPEETTGAAQTTASAINPCLQYTDTGSVPPQDSACYDKMCSADPPAEYCAGSEPSTEETTGAAQTTSPTTPLNDLNSGSPPLSTVFQQLVECFPSMSSSSCAQLQSTQGETILQCSKNIPNLGNSQKLFVRFMAEGIYRVYIEKCIEQYCITPYFQCFGTQEYASFHIDHSYMLICNYMNTPSAQTCLKAADAGCFSNAIKSFYDNFFGILCFSFYEYESSIGYSIGKRSVVNPPPDPDAWYLMNISACYPESLTEPIVQNISQVCSNVEESVNCSEAVSKTGVSQNATNIALNIYTDFMTECDTEPACSTAAASCFEKLYEQLGPNANGVAEEAVICANTVELSSCFSSISISGCSSFSQFDFSWLDDFLNEECSLQVCQSGLEYCYWNNIYIPSESASPKQNIAGWCSASQNTATCLEKYESACSSPTIANNSATQLITQLETICAPSADACYVNALMCLYETLPTLAIPASMWTPAQDNTICLNYNETSSCLIEAAAACDSPGGASAVNSLETLLSNQCADQCSTTRRGACDYGMINYLNDSWCTPVQVQRLCNTIAQPGTCYNYITKRCTNGTQADIDLNVDVINAVLTGIAQSCAYNETSTPFPSSPPPGCDINGIATLFTNFLESISNFTDILGTSSQSGGICSLWSSTKKQIEAMAAANCAGPIGDRILNTTTHVDNVVTSVCNVSPQCNIADVSQRVRQLADDCGAAQAYTPFTNYQGQPRQLYCVDDASAPSLPGSGIGCPQSCSNYPFQWGYICAAKSQTIEAAMSETSQCDSAVQEAVLTSINMTTIAYNSDCSMPNVVCNVDQGKMCFDLLFQVGVSISTCSKNTKPTLCSLVLQYQACIWENLIQCSPYVDVYIWQLTIQFVATLNCPTPIPTPPPNGNVTPPPTYPPPPPVSIQRPTGTTAASGPGTTVSNGPGSTGPNSQGTTGPNGQGTTGPNGQGTTGLNGQGTTTTSGPGTTTNNGPGTTTLNGPGTTTLNGMYTTLTTGQSTTTTPYPMGTTSVLPTQGPPPSGTPQCGEDAILACFLSFTDELFWYSMASMPDSSYVCEQWTLTLECIAAITSANSGPQCSACNDMIQIFILEIQLVVDVLCSPPTCYIQDCYNSLRDLQYFVSANELQAPNGHTYPPGTGPGTKFCGGASMTLQVISNAAGGCPSALVSKAKAWYLQIQASTGLTCITPTDIGVCQNGAANVPSMDTSQSYNCYCPPRYSGPTCTQDNCPDVSYYGCLQASFQAILDSDYHAFCSLSTGVQACLSANGMICPSYQVNVTLTIIGQLQSLLGCSGANPKPSPGCEATTYECLQEATASVSVLWDSTNGGLTAEVSNTAGNLRGCKSKGCTANFCTSIEAFISLLSITETFGTVHELINELKNFEYGTWLVHQNKPSRNVPSLPNSQQISALLPKNRQPTCNHPEDDIGLYDTTHQNDGSQDTCWFIGHHVDNLNVIKARSSCGLAVEQLIIATVATFEQQYLQDGECSNPTENNQCCNSATCQPHGYGYICNCPPGLSGVVCEIPPANAICDGNKAFMYIEKLKSQLQTMLKGSSFSPSQCSELSILIENVASALVICNNEISFVTFDFLWVYISVIQGNCNGSPVPETLLCELNAAFECVFDACLDLISPTNTDPYCGVLDIGYTCSLNIDVSCMPPATNFSLSIQSSFFGSLQLECHNPSCDTPTAKGCLDNFQSCIGQATQCSSVSPTNDCVRGATQSCDSKTRSVFTGQLSALLGPAQQQCINPCDAQPCHNGGTCSPQANGYKCACPPGKQGDQCDYEPGCNLDAVMVCLEASEEIIFNVFSPGCANPALSCTLLNQLNLCFLANTKTCPNSMQDEFDFFFEIIDVLTVICEASSSSCSSPPSSCQMEFVVNCTIEFTWGLLQNLAHTGCNYRQICGEWANLNANCTAAVLFTGCPKYFQNQVEQLTEQLFTVVDTPCSQPICQVAEANKCISALKWKLQEAQQQKFCPHDSRNDTCSAISQMAQCATDNVYQCSDSEAAPVLAAYQALFSSTSTYCPLPCQNPNTSPCSSANQCTPVGFDSYTCDCGATPQGGAMSHGGWTSQGGGTSQGGSSSSPPSCDNDVNCNLEVAIECIASFELFILSNGYLDSPDFSSQSQAFCAKASASLQCVIAAFVECSNGYLSAPYFAQLLYLQSSVGWTCYNPCDANPCQNKGACTVQNLPPTIPCNSPPPPPSAMSCKCLPGSSGTFCESSSCSQSTVDQCLVTSACGYVHAQTTSPYSCSSPPSCSDTTTQCGSTLPSIVNAVQSNAQLTCPLLAECNWTALQTACPKYAHLDNILSWNATSSTAASEFCSLYVGVRACIESTQLGNCDEIYITLDPYFQLFCIENPVPACPIRGTISLLQQLERDLVLISTSFSSSSFSSSSKRRRRQFQEHPSPSPTTTASPAPPAPTPQPGLTLSITCQGTLSVWVDGVPQQLTGASSEQTVKTVSLQSNSRRINALCVNQLCECSSNGLVASVTGDVLDSNTTWHASSACFNDWYDSESTYTAWASAYVQPKCRGQIPSSISKSAQWIWAFQGNSTACFVVYLPQPPSSQVTPAPTTATTTLTTTTPQTTTTTTPQTTTTTPSTTTLTTTTTTPSTTTTQSTTTTETTTTTTMGTTTTTTPPTQEHPSPPLPPPSNQPEPGNACKHAQDLIDYTETECGTQAGCSQSFSQDMNNTIASLVQKYSGSQTCANACAGPTQCQNGATCVPAQVSYRCACLPGYYGWNCENGANCDLADSVSVLYQSLLIWISLTSSYTQGDWDYICTTTNLDLAVLYEILAVEFMPCTDTTEWLFEAIGVFIQFTETTCSSPPTPPTPPSCEVTGIANCAFNAIHDLYGPGADLCTGHSNHYQCLAQLSLTCCDSTNILVNARSQAWALYQSACPVPCNTVQAQACVAPVQQAYPAGQPINDKSQCGLLSKAEACVSVIVTECDAFVRAQIMVNVESTLSPVRGFCDNPCRDTLCENGGICIPQSGSSSYQCQCIGDWTESMCDQTPQCDLIKIQACVSASINVIVSGLMDPCNNPISCDITATLSACLKANVEACPGFISAQISIIVKAVETVTCGSSSSNCVTPQTPPPNCWFSELLACAVSFTDTVTDILTDECGADYLTVCQSYNLTVDCFARYSGGCESNYYNENFQITEAFLLSLTGEQCSGSLCWMDQATNSLTYLSDLIEAEMAAGINNMPRYLMPKQNKDIFCGKIWEAVQVTVDSVSQCSQGGVVEEILVELNVQVQQISEMCPLPCYGGSSGGPCTQYGTCQQTDYGQCTCVCTDDAPNGQCEIPTTCNTDAAYICIELFISETTYNGQYTPMGSVFTLPASYDFCGAMTKVTACLELNLQECTNGEYQLAFDLLIDIQTLVGVDCIDSCSCKPCQHNGECKPSSENTHDYNCSCSPYHTGKNCENDVCPTSTIEICFKNAALQCLTLPEDNPQTSSLCSQPPNGGGGLAGCVNANITVCSPVYQDVCQEAVSDTASVFQDLCAPKPPPRCGLLTVQCVSEVVSLVVYMQKAQSNGWSTAYDQEICILWFACDACFAKYESCNGDSELAYAISIYFSLICVPNNNSPPPAHLTRPPTTHTTHAPYPTTAATPPYTGPSTAATPPYTGPSTAATPPYTGPSTAATPSEATTPYEYPWTSPSTPSQNSTCALKSCLACEADLSDDLWWMNKSRPSNGRRIPPKPDSCQRVHDQCLPPYQPPPPDQRTQLCWDINFQLTCTANTVAQCPSNYGQKVYASEELELSLSLGDSGMCDSLCESSRPCQNLGTCVDTEPGFSCTCPYGFSGDYCEIAPQCDYFAALECLDILYYETFVFENNMFSIYCSIIDQRLSCLEINLIACSQNDFFFLQIVYLFLQSIQVSCQANVGPTCEQVQIYESLSEIAEIFYPYSPPPLPNTVQLCSALQSSYNVTQNVSITCMEGGASGGFSLSVQLGYKLSGALDYYCPTPNCSLTAADVCLDSIYNMIVSDLLGLSNNTCDQYWQQQACVQWASSACDDVKQGECNSALNDLLALSQSTCPSPCNSKPCRNGGTCMQTSVNTYVCQCPDEYNGQYCQTSVTCDWVAVQNCLTPCSSLIAVGMLNPCDTPPDNCGPLLNAPNCIRNATTTCPPSQQPRVDNLIKSMTGASAVCSPDRTEPEGCNSITPECNAQVIEQYYINFLNQAFIQLSASCIVDYFTLCDSWNFTLSLFADFDISCIGAYDLSINASISFLMELTGSICVSGTVCLPSYYNFGLQCITAESNECLGTQPYLLPPDQDNFCIYIDNILAIIENDVEQCPSSNGNTVRQKCQSTKNSYNATCSFPCDNSPCQNGATCTTTGAQSYSCTCQGDWMGPTCNQVAPYPLTTANPVPTNGSNNAQLLQVTAPLPIPIFCNTYNSFYISQNGYISFTGGSITSFSQFRGIGQTLVAPLFTEQDCSCAGSSLSYQVYTQGSTQVEAQAVLDRAQQDVINNGGPADFYPQEVIIVNWVNAMPDPCSVYEMTENNLQGSTYQAIIITDLTNTYAVFIYNQTNTIYEGNNVYMGYTDQTGRTFGCYLSGTLAMNQFQSYMPTNTGLPGMWFYSLTLPAGTSCTVTQPATTPAQTCLNWYDNTMMISSADVDSCPCSANQASLDVRCHLVTINWYQICYSMNQVTTIENNGNSLQVAQTCCYDPWSSGALYTTPPFAGFPVLLNPAPSAISDAYAFGACCIQSNTYCSLFNLARPSSVCDSYSAPITSMIWGDPHLITTDNFYYDFNAIGEFWMIWTTDASFSLQCRTAQMQTSAGVGVNASAFVAFAAQQQGYAKVEVDLNPTRDGLIFYLNGVQQNLTSTAQTFSTKIYISASTTSFNATFPAGWSMTVGLGVRMLTIIQTVPGTAWGKTRGLLGRYDGDPTDDLTTPSGTILPINSSTETIYYDFGLKWQISNTTSLFTYPAGKTAASYVNATFVPAFSPPCNTAAENQTGNQICSAATSSAAQQNCLFDYCVSLDATVAEDTLTTQENYVTSQAVLSNNGPKLTISGLTPNQNGVYMVDATIGSQVSFVLNAVSQLVVTINVEIVGNVSQQAIASLTQINATASIVNYVFSWTPVNLVPVEVSFVAVDSNGGVSNKVQVVVVICNGCSDNGACVFSSWTPIYNGSAYLLAACDCTTGYAGLDCSQDYMGCAAMPCGANNTAACTDLTPLTQQATGVAYSCSSCPPGYWTSQCVDIDECKYLPYNSPCQICINTIGSYMCACNPGYQLATPGGLACVDINECADMTSGCPQQCTDMPGSFYCSCYAGYTGPNCSAASSCGANRCSYMCSMVNGVATCTCMAGFALASDGVSCQDIDECTNPALDKCSVPSSCVNTIGGYTCSCPIGQTIGPDLRTCQDCSLTTWGPNCTNQCNCGENVRACDRVTGCTVCQSGWTGNNCETDVNECLRGLAHCQPTAVCVNIPGTYLCLCGDGSGNEDCYATTPSYSTTGTPCAQCLNGGLCVFSTNQEIVCSCPTGYSGTSCEVAWASIQSGGPNITIIVPVVVIGVTLIIAAAVLIYYFFLVRPKKRVSRKYEQAPSDLTSDGSQTRFTQSSTRINQYWPRSPQRYAPQTYNPQNEENI